MPNIKSAMKRDAKSKELRAKNRADKTALKTVMKKFDAAVAGGDKTVAAESYKVAVKAVDKAASRSKNLLKDVDTGKLLRRESVTRYLENRASPDLLLPCGCVNG